MARKRLVPTKSRLQQNPDYYLRGRERRVRRERWEWPDAERHPDVGVTRASYADAWKASIGSSYTGERLVKYFTDRQYGDREASLEAAIAWRTQQLKRRPGFKSQGWKLSPEKAGCIYVNEVKGYAGAYMHHDGARCAQSFGFKKYGGKEHAIRLAELALEIWREEARRIANMSRSQQERIAARGGWTQVKGFPSNPREQLELNFG